MLDVELVPQGGFEPLNLIAYEAIALPSELLRPRRGPWQGARRRARRNERRYGLNSERMRLQPSAGGSPAGSGAGSTGGSASGPGSSGTCTSGITSGGTATGARLRPRRADAAPRTRRAARREGAENRNH